MLRLLLILLVGLLCFPYYLRACERRSCFENNKLPALLISENLMNKLMIDVEAKSYFNKRNDRAGKREVRECCAGLGPARSYDVAVLMKWDD